MKSQLLYNSQSSSVRKDALNAMENSCQELPKMKELVYANSVLEMRDSSMEIVFSQKVVNSLFLQSSSQEL